MFQNLNLDKIDSDDLLQEFINYSTNELGKIQISEIINNVETSNKVKEFIKKAKIINQPLGSDDYLACIHSSIKFIISKAEVISVAAIWLLHLWKIKVGIPNQIVNDTYFKNRIITILDKCDKYKVHINSRLNFFELFEIHLEKIINKPIEDKRDPYYWSLVAIEATSFYSKELNSNSHIWDEYRYNCFILNCGYIYGIKFPDEIDQIGWDNSIPEKNKFNELVLKFAANFYHRRA